MQRPTAIPTSGLVNKVSWSWQCSWLSCSLFEQPGNPRLPGMKEPAMNNSRLEGLAASAGLLFVVMRLSYLFLSPSMEPLASPAELARVYTQNEGALFLNFIGTLGFFFFLFFLGARYNALRQAKGGTG